MSLTVLICTVILMPATKLFHLNFLKLILVSVPRNLANNASKYSVPEIQPEDDVSTTLKLVALNVCSMNLIEECTKEPKKPKLNNWVLEMNIVAYRYAIVIAFAGYRH